MLTTSENVYDLMSHIIRVGLVTARDPARLRVQVECKDTVTDGLVSEWLQVLVPRAKDDQHYDLPDVGDQVVCLFLPHGREQGFVLGCMYASETTGAPPVKSGDKTHRKFKDGTTVEYDRGANLLSINAVGDISIVLGGNLTIRAGGIIKMNASHISMQE